MGLALAAVIIGAISLIMSVVQMIMAKQPKGPDMSGVEARKGFEMVTEGKPDNLALIYGRAKVGGIRTYHATSAIFEYENSNANTTFASGVQASYSGAFTEKVFNPITGVKERVLRNWENDVNTQLDDTLSGKRNEFLFFQQALCVGEIHAVYDVIIDESKYLTDPTLGSYGTPVYDGSSGEATKWKDVTKPRAAFRFDVHHATEYRDNPIDPALDQVRIGYGVANSIFTANFADRKDATFTGMSYASCVIRLDKDDPQFSQVPNLQFLVEGRRVRTIIKSGTTYYLSTDRTYTNNPAYCLLDYLMDDVVGGKVPLEEIDLESFYKSKLVCETIVFPDAIAGGRIWKPTKPGSRNGEDGNGKRDVPLYECNILLDTDKPLRENVQEILATMSDARLVWSRGQYRLNLEYTNNINANLIDPLEIPYVTLTDDDIVLDQDIEIAYPSASDRYNCCTIKFHNESNDFKEDAVNWPHKIIDTTLRGIGGIKYPAADFTWKDEGAGRRLLNKYGVWNGTINEINQTNGYGLVYHLIVNPHNDGDLWKLECYADQSMTIRMYTVNEVTGAKSIMSGFPLTVVWGETLGKIQNLSLPYRTIGTTASSGKYYRIEIDANNAQAEKGVAAVISNSSRVLWSTREIAYQSVQRLDYTTEVYDRMKREDNGLELELETSFAGITDYYHALSKAEELVKTSRTAYTIKFKYVVRNKYFEPGDYIIIDSETLNIQSLSSTVAIGDRHNYFRVNSVKISEDNTCEVTAQKFHWTQLAWTVKDGEYIRPPNNYLTLISPPFDVALFKEANNKNTSGILRWDAKDESDFLNYIIYMYEGGSRVGTSPPEFHEIGKSTIKEFVLPKLNVSSAIFAVRTQTRTGFSEYGYTSTTEAEEFEIDVYGFLGLTFSNVSNVISWTSFSVYKKGVKIIDISSGSYTAVVNYNDKLYIYFDTTISFTYNLSDIRNKTLLGTYKFGEVVVPMDVSVYAPSSLTTLGRTDTQFNTRDAEISWVNNIEEPLEPTQYLLQISNIDNVTKASYMVTTTSFKFTYDMNKALFVTPSRTFKARVYSIDAVGNMTRNYIEATFTNTAPSVTQFSVSPSFRTALAKAELVSDSDIVKYVFKKYSEATPGGTPVIVETLNNYANIEATEGIDYWYTVTVHDEYGAGPESARVTTQSVSFSGTMNTGSVFIYKRSATPPSVPSASVTYTFANKSVTGLTNNWELTAPSGTDQLYMSMASALSSEPTDTILSTEWSTPVKYEINAVNYRSAMIYAYQRSATAITTNPGDVTYDFTSNAITTVSLANNWLKAIPSGSDPLYIITSIANSQTNTDTVLANEWSTPVVLAKDGAKGDNGLNSAVFGIENASSTFNKNATGQINPSAGIVLTTSYQNITGTITYQWQKNGTNISGATSSSYTVTTTDYASVTTNAYKCIITGTINGVTSSLNDVITIPLLIDGSSSPVVVLSNENVTIPAPNTGYAGMTFSSANCNVQVYIGTNALTYNALGGANTFKLSIAPAGVTVTQPTSAAIAAPTAMSADLAVTDITVTIYDASNTALTPIIKRITYSVSRTGSIGLSGDAVDIIFIRNATQPQPPTASASTPTNWYSDVTSVPAGANPLWSSVGIKPTGSTTYTWDTPSRIEGASVAEVTVYTRGVPTTTPSGGTYTFGAASPLTTVPTSTGATWSASIPLGTAAVYTSRAVVNTAAGNTSAVAITGWSTPVISLQNGVDATFVDLLSESDITSADNDGKNYSLPPANSLKLYAGGTAITTNVTYSGGGNKNGLIAAIDATTGVITFTGATPAWTTDIAAFTFTARYNNIDYSAVYTYAKSKQGTPSVIIDLKSETAAVFADNAGNVATLPSGNAVLIYEGGALVTSGITYAVDALNHNGLFLAINTSGEITLTQTTWTSDSESFTITGTYKGTSYTAVYHIVKAKTGAKGLDAVRVDLLSESDVTPANSDGTGYSLPPTNNLKLYVGAAAQTTGVAYSVSAAQSGLTAAIDASGNITFSGTSWTSDLATFTFSAVYNSITYQKTYTYAKSKKGLNTVLVDIKSDADVVTATNAGSVTTLPSGNAIVVYEAGAVVTTGITYAGGVTKNGLTLAIDASGNISLNQSSGPWSSDSESFTITTTYKSVTYTNIYTIAKAKAGAQGISTYPATVYYNGVPSGTPVGGSYNFNINVLTGPTTAGWQTTPFSSTTTGVYVSTQTFTSNNGGASTGWSSPVLYAKSGTDGNPGGPGTPGTSVYTATVYTQQSSTPGQPYGGYYTFGGALAAPYGWQITQPPASTIPTWSCEYTFSTTNTGLPVYGGYWINVKICAQNGANGVSVPGIQGNSATRAFTISTVGTAATIANYTTYGITSLPTSPLNNWMSTTQTPSNNQAQWQSDGIIDYAAQSVTWSAPYLTVFKVDTLSAFTTNTGLLNLTGYLNVNTNNVAIRSASTNLGGQGFYLGLDNNGAGVFSVGGYVSGVFNGLIWNGNSFTISGPIISQSNLTSAAQSVMINPTSLAGLDASAASKLSGIADGATKTKVYRQSYAPSGATNDIWVDTTNPSFPETKTWDGYNWQKSAGISSAEGSKLSGIQAGATVGATFGVNIANVTTPYITANAVTDYKVYFSAANINLAAPPANSSGITTVAAIGGGLFIPANDVSTVLTGFFSFHFFHSDTTPGTIQVSIKANGSIFLTTFFDVGNRLVAGSVDNNYTLPYAYTAPAYTAVTFTVDVKISNGNTSSQYWAGANMNNIYFITLLGKR